MIVDPTDFTAVMAESLSDLFMHGYALLQCHNVPDTSHLSDVGLETHPPHNHV